MFRTEKIKENVLAVPDSVSYGEDAAVTYPYLLNACKSVYIMEQCLYYYRQNPSSMTNAYNKAQTEGTVDLIQYLQDVAKKNGSREFWKQLDMYTLAILLWNFSNEKKSGMKHFLQKRQKLKRFISATHAKDCMKRTDLSRIDRKRRFALVLISCGGMDVLLFVLIFQRIFEMAKLYKRYA